MKQIFILLWLITPVGLLAFHYGPGQQHMVNDAAADQIREASELAEIARESGTIEDWTKAIEAYESALAMIPEDKEEEKARTRLAIARSRIGQGDLVQALIDLEALLDEEMQTPRGEGLEEEIRETLARNEYFVAWRMRLDGSEINAWRREADNARRYFRYLAESQEEQAAMESDASSDPQNSLDSAETSLSGAAPPDDAFAFGHDERLGKNLEASVRMMMMDLDMLRALPLPPEVQNAQGRGVGEGMGEQRGDGQGDGEGEGQGQGQSDGEGDARSRGATEGERPEGIGS